MANPSTDSHLYVNEDKNAFYFITDGGRRYSVTCEGPPFFSNNEFAFAEQTYEVLLTPKLFLITLMLRNDNPHPAAVLVSFALVNAYLRSQK